MIQREVEHASQKQHLPRRMGNSEARLHKREVTNVQGKIHQVRRGFESRLERLEKKERPREEVSIRIHLARRRRCQPSGRKLCGGFGSRRAGIRFWSTRRLCCPPARARR